MDIKIQLFSILLLGLTLVLLRIIQILPATKFHQAPGEPIITDDVKNKRIMVFLGSGGHTGEMIRILSQFDPSFLQLLQRRYLISSGDDKSILKLKDFEKGFLQNDQVNYIILPRARNVGEKIIISVKNSIVSILKTFRILVILALKNQLPDVLLINGPGTAATLSYLIMILKFFKICRTKIIYIESLARVNKLSITGKLVRPISDRFVVQWNSLQKGRLEFHGILV